MRRNNSSMVRQVSGKKTIEDQLRILYEEESVRAGFRYVNPGALIGLHRNVLEEIAALLTHVTRLAERGAIISISMPRLRPAQGSKTCPVWMTTNTCASWRSSHWYAPIIASCSRPAKTRNFKRGL